MLWKDVKLEERSDQEPKFNKNNKTDRKIVISIIIVVAVLIVILAGLIVIYYAFFHPKTDPNQTVKTTEAAIKLLLKKNG
ncbi:MAG: hypothetical protein K6F07_00520 [Bacilli bacterium]|nr:hypothetical protein [Bacilli bacterium]